MTFRERRRWRDIGIEKEKIGAGMCTNNRDERNDGLFGKQKLLTTYLPIEVLIRVWTHDC